MPNTKEGYLWTRQDGIVQGLDTNAVLSRDEDLKPSYDVVVIGTGFAGLIAARDISNRRNTSVLLVEARDRIGGRTWTANALGEEFEMGGTWLHWFQPHVYSELHRYGLHRNLKTSSGSFAAEKTLYKPANGTVTEVSTLKTNQRIEEIATKFFQVDGMTSRELMPYPHDPFREPALWKKYDHLSIRQRLDQMDEFSEHDKGIFETLTGSFGSGRGTDVGFVEVLRWYALAGHNMAQTFELAGVYKIGKGGMTSFANAILTDYEGDVAFDSVVSEVDETGDGVSVKMKGGREVQCSAVVCTIPLNVLSSITFTPSLSPLRQEAIKEGHINKGAKAHFQISGIEPAWLATSNPYGQPPSPWCFAFSDHNKPASAPDASEPNEKGSSFCVAFGYNGHITDPTDHALIVKSFNENLRPEPDVETYLTHDWMNDPFAKGTWSCWGPGSMSKCLQELQKPHGRVIFASADWASGWRGFVDGAIEQGVEAARKVRDMLAMSK